MTFNLYTANAHGQKLSGFTKIEAENFKAAKEIYKGLLIQKGINLATVEILAAR